MASNIINITQGNSAQFTVEFLDSSGNITIPSSGNVSVTYTSTSGNSSTYIVGLTQSGQFFTGTWSSTGALVGFATWIATTATNSNAANGTIRVIDP